MQTQLGLCCRANPGIGDSSSLKGTEEHWTSWEIRIRWEGIARELGQKQVLGAGAWDPAEFRGGL